jgi:small subunit ribosomal protein S4
MARYRGPRLRIIRRLGELPGLTQKVCTRNYPAGQHGPKKKVVGNQKSKESQYAIRLKEKQKLRFNYGINERQLIKYVREARRRNGSTGEILLQILETRLDNVLFRLGFAPTIAAARQLISHGHISVNSKRINIPSYLCKINDNISVNEVSRNFIKKSLDRFSALPVPSHLEVNTENLMGKVKTLANRDNIGIQINELLVVEYYSRKV